MRFIAWTLGSILIPALSVNAGWRERKQNYEFMIHTVRLGLMNALEAIWPRLVSVVFR